MLISGIEIEIVRKRIKNMYLRVHADGSVTVSAPMRRSNAEITAFVESRLDWLQSHREKLLADLTESTSAYTYADGEFGQTVTEYIGKWERLLGVKAEHVSFRDMKTRWGSCTPKTRRIRLNSRLRNFPPECLEYIVLHELAHIIEPNHSVRFYAIIERHMPDWKTRRAKLK